MQMTDTPSMENLADISEPQVPPESRKINKFDFPSVYSVSMKEKQFLLLKLNKQMEN